MLNTSSYCKATTHRAGTNRPSGCSINPLKTLTERDPTFTSHEMQFVSSPLSGMLSVHLCIFLKAFYNLLPKQNMLVQQAYAYFILIPVIRLNTISSVPQRTTEGSALQRGTQGIHVPMPSSGLKAKREEHTSQDSLSSSPKSTDSLNMKPSGDRPRERQHSVQSGNKVAVCCNSLELESII